MGNFIASLLEQLLVNPLQFILQICVSLFRFGKHRPCEYHSIRDDKVWDDKFEKSLMKEIKQLPVHSDSLQNVLIVGPIGAGKSSFINSVIKIFQRLFCYADYPHGNTVFCLPDEINIGEVINIVDSEVFVNSSIEQKYLFNSVRAIEGNTQRFRSECQIHCVIFIVSALDVIDNPSEQKQVVRLRQQLKRTSLVPVVLILTMVDEICKEEGEDMFQSKKVIEVIETTSKMFEMDKVSIHPVVNYVNDSRMRTEKNIPLLLALKHSLNRASQYYYESLPLQRDYDDNEQLLPSNEMRGLPAQIPTGRELTTESMSSQYLAAIKRIEKLLNENNLPKNDDLQSIYKDQGSKYEHFKEICEEICKIIKKRLYNDAVKNVWPARNLANKNVVFVVESAREAAVHPIFQGDLEILIDHGDSTRTKESIKIMTKERNFLKNKTDEYRQKLKRLQPILMRHSKQLMDKHKNITAILPCVIKSVGFGTPGKHSLLEILCISIHVKRKIRGLIPLDEEPIPTIVEDIPTDVVQGEYRLFSNGSKDYHTNLKMGLAIHAHARNDEGDILGGTLGCFVEHKRYGMCCITNAHIVLQQSEFQHLFRCGYMEYETSNEKPVFQPLSFNTEPFGKVVVAAGDNGNDSKPGLEVALIKILKRPPLSGSFPQSTSETVPTFTFNTGNVTDVDSLQLDIEVFKFGMETGPTLGFLHSHSASFRDEKGFSLHQQIVVMPREGENFADGGDSGSCVFIGFSRPGRESVIGLLTGGARGGKVFVTPIYDILQSVKCQPCLYRFENIDDFETYMSMSTQCAGGEETMDCNN